MPARGQHTDSLLAKLAQSASDIATLREAGAI